MIKIRQEIYKYKENIVELRRKFHTIPECSFEEKETSKFIYDYLADLLPDKLERFAKTGVRAVFLSPDAKKTIAIRADMDALPISERTSHSFASKHIGQMHACGHDGHMTMALIVAKIVSSRQGQKHNIVFIFQPAEESIGGAQPMVGQGVMNNPDIDEIYALHLWPELEQGKIGVKQGILMSAMDDLNVKITGVSCHGAKPQQGNDALVAAAYLVGAVQSIVSRNIEPGEAAVVTLGKIEGGEARNIICRSVMIEGTVRSYSEQTSKLLLSRINDMLDGIGKMFAVKCENIHTMSFPPVINPKCLFDKVTSLLGEEERVLVDKVMVSEDFSYFQKEVDGFYALLGTGSEKYCEPLHSRSFDFDEAVLLDGVEYFLRVLEIE